MSEALHWQPDCSIDMLHRRAEMYASIRNFFATREMLEVHTPVISQHAVCDVHIDSIVSCDAISSSQGFLRTSPEFALKRLLAAGCGDCYELGPVFRAGESGRWHNPEFTLLEWYRCDWSRQQLAQECIELLYVLHADFHHWPLHECSYRELCLEQIGCDLLSANDASLLQLATVNGLPPGKHWLRTQLLDYLFSQLVQRQLPQQQITIVHEFPAEQAALAELMLDAQGTLVANRFELYLGSIEIANAYQELTDADELATRFASENALRQTLGKAMIEPDQSLLDAMRHGLPACAGVALGVDRLLAVMQAAAQLRDVLTFSKQRA